MWTGHDLVFIDFEGEPTRPMGERSIKRSPLVDVAGLYRSLDYASRNALHTAIARGVVVGDQAKQRLERWRAAVTSEMQRELIDQYVTEIADADLIPADAEMRLLLELFVLEKALYEIRYEVSHRPDWVSWPLAAAAELIGAATGR